MRLLFERVGDVSVGIARVAGVVDVALAIEDERQFGDRGEPRVHEPFLRQSDAGEGHLSLRGVEGRAVGLGDCLVHAVVAIVGAGPPVVRVEGVEVELHLALVGRLGVELHVPFGDDHSRAGPGAVPSPGIGEGVGDESVRPDGADAHGVGAVGLDRDVVADFTRLGLVDDDVAVVGRAQEAGLGDLDRRELREGVGAGVVAVGAAVGVAAVGALGLVAVAAGAGGQEHEAHEREDAHGILLAFRR